MGFFLWLKNLFSRETCNIIALEREISLIEDEIAILRRELIIEGDEIVKAPKKKFLQKRIDEHNEALLLLDKITRPIEFPKDKTKETSDFQKLLDAIGSQKPKQKYKDGFYQKNCDGIWYFFKDKLFLFDEDSYRLFQKRFLEDYRLLLDGNYLVGEKNNFKIGFHRWLMFRDVEDLSKKIGCPMKDVHVHHKNKEPKHNVESNLEVLYKDDHAKRHDYDTWSDLEAHGKNRDLKYY